MVTNCGGLSTSHLVVALPFRKLDLNEAVVPANAVLNKRLIKQNILIKRNVKF